MKSYLIFILLALIFVQCTSTPEAPVEEGSKIWEDRDYSLEELIIRFQEWIPSERLEGKVLFLNNAFWEDFELTEPEEIEKGNYRYLAWKDDSMYMTPADYAFYLIGTLDYSEENDDFFTETWSAREDITTLSGETYSISRSHDWLEAMSVNYSVWKTAHMMLEFANKHVNDDAMLPIWKEEKERWIKEMSRIEEEHEN